LAESQLSALNDRDTVVTMKHMEERFIALWARSCAPRQATNTSHIWQNLVKFYGESHRAYHTLEHIEDCLDALDQAKDELDNVDQVELAIWFHDIIFAPGQADNEERSAEYFQSVAIGNLSGQQIFSVCELIMATMHHHHRIKPPGSVDSQFMVDIDLSSFGLGEKAFAENTDKLRLEQPGQSTEEFERATMGFFHSLLQRERIYYTRFFFELLEEKARNNILAALKRMA
jgi:predicted metal-dependent HD superfamily phosphohydrolase